jgi:acyl-CoA reductase-like NAD-dependent aldehyde dehydrogenase
VSSLIAARHSRLLDLFNLPQRLGRADSLSAELLPLADAARWLAKHAHKVLSPRKARAAATPWWIGRLRSRVLREPVGVVMIIGTWNYPLYLTGVQMLHALVAGNAVVLKPAPGTEELMRAWLDLLADAGFPPAIVAMLPAEIESVSLALRSGVDKVVLTGSSSTGRRLLADLASTLTPATLELGGCDAIIVLPTANPTRVVDALLFGLRLNGGATCMAPRRLLIDRQISSRVLEALKKRLSEVPAVPVRSTDWRSLRTLCQQAVDAGASVLQPDGARSQELPPSGEPSIEPVVLLQAAPSMEIAQSDLFGPWLLWIETDGSQDAIEKYQSCPYALTASVFGEEAHADSVARRIQAGFVTVNDCIVPTVDPQLPFGGRRQSGYGVTRGSEGLLEMTACKVISCRKGTFLPHLQRPRAGDEGLLAGILLFTHGSSLATRWKGLSQIVRAIVQRINEKTRNK